MQYVTVDEAYEIASEVAQKTITKFLTNLVRLVPDAEGMVDDIKAEQWRAYRESKSGRPVKKQSEDWEDAVDDDDDEDDYMRKVYEEGRKKKPARKSEPEDEEEEEEDNTEDVFEQIAHGGKGHVRNMNEIFPDDMEKQITLKDDHQMPSNDPAVN